MRAPLLGLAESIYYFQVRASSLQELVYKGGQAGVTKATVTITFDNTDKKQSPLGYESFEEITVSRQVRSFLMMSQFLKEVLQTLNTLMRFKHFNYVLTNHNNVQDMMQAHT